MRGNGERIGPQNLPTSSVAGGIWNLLNQQRAQQRGAWPSATPAVVTDPYFMYVPLLLNTTSTNAQQNNTFLDSSSNAFTITRNGTPTQGAFTPYQPSGYWSNYFDLATTSYLTISSTTSFNLVGDFTIEAWVNPTSIFSGANGIIDARSAAGTSAPWYFYMYQGKITFFDGSNYSITTTLISTNVWTHVAVVRSGSTLTIYLNGTAGFTNSSYGTASISPGTTSAVIGTKDTSVSKTLDQISNVRVVVGTAVYTSTFTPPTTPLTAISGTVLLTCQSNRFKDNSTNNFAITVNGTPKVQAFQPFAPAASYSAATYGGSGYFPGSSYLSLASNAALSPGTGDFTVEAWILPTVAYSTYSAIYSPGATTNGMFFGKITGGLGIRAVNTADIISATAPAINQWVHVAVTRSGTSMRIFFNGVQQGATVTNSTNFATSAVYIGDDGAGTANWNGYISNFRFVKGTAVYTADFTPPTLPLTAVSGTSLLTNFTNAGIYDAAWQNDVTTVGDAQASTTQYKWSPTSMKFDGTGDYLSLISSPALDVNNGDFTIEAWVYPVAATNYNGIIALGNSIAGGYASIRLRMNSSQQLELYISSNGSSWATFGTTTNTISLNAWTYLALVRSGSSSGNVKLYINGTASSLALTFTGSGYTGGQYSLGCVWSSSVATEFWNGYIQDLRITKGVARTITTPTAAFPTR